MTDGVNRWFLILTMWLIEDHSALISEVDCHLLFLIEHRAGTFCKMKILFLANVIEFLNIENSHNDIVLANFDINSQKIKYKFLTPPTVFWMDA